jgi:hypothetical protein
MLVGSHAKQSEAWKVGASFDAHRGYIGLSGARVDSGAGTNSE